MDRRWRRCLIAMTRSRNLTSSPSARTRPCGGTALPLPALAKGQISPLGSAPRLQCVQAPLLCPKNSFRISPANAFVRLLCSPRVFCEIEHASFRLQPSLTCQPVCSEALVVLLKFGFSLAVRYLLPGRQRMECPAFSLISDLLLGGPFRLDHLVFAFSRSTRMSRNSSGPLSNRRFRTATALKRQGRGPVGSAPSLAKLRWISV